jgi:oxygen-independent coproporphyrinogen-3 oxidase
METMQKEIIYKYRKFNLKNYKINSIYFGGGSPSLLSAEHFNFVLNLLNTLWEIPEDIEISIETNPAHLLPQYINNLSKTAINRISFGIQSFQKKLSPYTNRNHSLDHIQELIETAKKNKLKVNLDFIYALPEENLEDLKNDLEIIKGLDIDHLSFYELEIHENTEIHKLRKEKAELFPSEEKILKMHELITTDLNDSYWEHYEISNWAKEKNYSQHNLNFWKNEDYIGFGPSADSKIQNQLIHNLEDLKSYYNLDNFYQISPLTNAENDLQYIMLGLRINTGIDLNKLDSKITKALLEFNEEIPRENFIQSDNEKIILSEKGFLKYNYFLEEYSNIIYDHYSEN